MTRFPWDFLRWISYRELEGLMEKGLFTQIFPVNTSVAELIKTVSLKTSLPEVSLKMSSMVAAQHGCN